MGDAGEGLVDAESRVQERLEELARERAERPRTQVVRDPEAVRAVESLRLARAELEQQLAATTNERRKSMLHVAIADVEKRIGAAEAANRPL
jgi:hypothetical protein